MIIAYTDDEFNSAISKENLNLKCESCNMIFKISKKNIKYELLKKRNRYRFCSSHCYGVSLQVKNKLNCKNCNKEFFRPTFKLKKSKNHFCSKSCGTTYNNKHKTHGNRRSKLEKWLEEQLIILYSNLEIHFNQKNAISSELDIYIPSLNLAFELNGIFHYEPIYGVDKLLRVQENDISKSKACHDAKIDLCIIDTSAQSYVKPHTSQKYLDIIVEIINNRN